MTELNCPRAQRERYEKLLHALQSGVAATMEHDPTEVAPKHLRVGVASALVNCQAIAALLMRKGIFTKEEYYAALIEDMEQEVAMYEANLTAHYGGQTQIKLG
jgi:hypothetical protein